MAKFIIPKEQLAGLPPIPAGVYDFRFDGYEPKLTKPRQGKDQSINLNPKLVIINHTDDKIRDRKINEFCNVKAGFIRRDLVHALGLTMEDETGESPCEPGEFQGDADKPESLVYYGPLLGRVGKIELAQVPNQNGTGFRTEVKRYFCAVPGCTVRHSESYQ